MLDLGELGEARSEPVIINIDIKEKLAGLTPWLVVLVLLGLRSNRRRAAWLILLPLLATQTLGLLALSFLPGGGSTTGIFMLMLMTLAMSVSAWWLLLGGGGRAGKARRLLAALGAYLAVTGVSCLAYFGNWAGEMSVVLLYTGISMVAILAGNLLSGWRARRRLHAGTLRLALLQGVSTIIFTLLGVVASATIIMLVNENARRSFMSEIGSILPQMLMVGLVLGLFLNLIVQPFMLLAGLNGFWRERARRVFGLEPLALPQPPERQPEPEPVEIDA